jgi:prepilin-type N-terminal cleavage/methylation domain-containing protein
LKKAFTFIELVFVIVVLGILSIGGSDMYLRIYNTYFESRTYNDMQAKSQLALDQIANRLTNRIKSSLIVSTDTNYSSLESSGAIPANQTYRIEWIESANDALRGMANSINIADTYTPPGWSGFIDLDNSDNNFLDTPGGNLTVAEAIISSLSYGDINLSDPNPLATRGSAVIIFPDAAGSIDQYGWRFGLDTNLTHPIYRNTDSSFRPIAPTRFRGVYKEVFEQYQLAFSAYALEYNPATRNIILYYNYQPWNNERHDTNTTQSTLFVENVSNFIFQSVGSMLKIQICINRADHQISATNEGFSVCKERAIF